ncbi:MAG: hypothetical protein RLY86_1122 [Pseudomonadota bacterium]|jgi:uncharacterized protein with NAD-binding domain and iron-sulfur cluster
MGSPKKVLILGGGIGGLSTAFHLTSQPGWQENYDVTVMQLGWRLGGKCASGRGPHARIEEHGIHGFLGMYYNALSMMRDCYAEANRSPDCPIHSFETAFHTDDSVLMHEYRDRQWLPWQMALPTNSLYAGDAANLKTLEDWLGHLIEIVRGLTHEAAAEAFGGLGERLARGTIDDLLDRIKAALAHAAEEAAKDVLEALDRFWLWLSDKLVHLIDGNTTLRRLFVTIDYMLTLVRGTIADGVLEKGFDGIDGETWYAWLKRHGAQALTIASPLAFNTPNLSYQYPDGDTSRPPYMSAAAYLNWSLRTFAYLGHFGYLFAAGTGETIIAPLYEVLKRRGVKFEFFRKVEAIRATQDATSVAEIDVAIQATPKNGTYEPTYLVKNLPSWPAEPFYDQLVEGDALKAGDIDLESWWTPWQPVGRTTLRAGQDFDTCVLAIAIGAAPYIAQDLIAKKPDVWGRMVQGIPTVQTQSMQLWFTPTLADLGATVPSDPSKGIMIGATFANPVDGFADMTHLIGLEDWDPANPPGGLLYICGPMHDYDAAPPFSDHDYPKRMADRVKYQCIQYLQAAAGGLLPQGVANAVDPPADPAGLGFGTLHPTDPARAGIGIQRFDQQFWRANIDPTERYTTSPPGSAACRLKAWDTGFANLVVAGDWIYTGLNVGSVEGTVMSGMLASHAVCGAPALDDIIGYQPFGRGAAV